MLGRPTVVVFDFDGTLVNRDSLFDFSVRYCLRRPARLLLLAAMLPWAAVCALRSTETALSVLLWAMTLGCSTRRLVSELRRYGRDLLPSAANEAIFGELTRHLRAGDRVFIATGSVPLLVRALLTARGLPWLPIAGSRLCRKWGGLVAQTHCTGETKVRELHRRFGVRRWSVVYTNSFADCPLMHHTPEITLVGPSARTLKRTQNLIGPETTLRVLPAA